MLPKNLVHLGETLVRADGGLGSQLEKDLVFCRREPANQKLELLLLGFVADSCKTTVWSVRGCNPGPGGRSKGGGSRCRC